MTEAAGSKRVNEGGNSWEGGKKMRGDSLTLRFLLQSKHAGGIIGKGGETIKRLRNEFSASVTVPDTNTQERVLTITADQDNCMKVLRECLPLVHEAPHPVNSSRKEGGNQYEIDFLVHSSQVGGIIGKAGYKIKEIRESTNASIKVYPDCLPDSSERVVAIGGSEDELIATMEQIFVVMEENPIKGNISLYDPSYDHSAGYNYDGYNNNNYNPAPYQGGMRGGGGRGGRGGRGGPRGGMRGGGGGGYGQGGYGGDYGNNFTGDNYAVDNNFSGNNWGQNPASQDFSYGSGGGGGGYNSGNQQGGGSFGTPVDSSTADGNSTQVTVPNDMAGAIIGRGGERIRQIRQKCGADIKFSDSEAGKSDRLITISGTHDQIQHAQYLMQQCVREHHGAGR